MLIMVYCRIFLRSHHHWNCELLFLNSLKPLFSKYFQTIQLQKAQKELLTSRQTKYEINCSYLATLSSSEIKTKDLKLSRIADDKRIFWFYIYIYRRLYDSKTVVVLSDTMSQKWAFFPKFCWAQSLHGILYQCTILYRAAWSVMMHWWPFDQKVEE